MGGEPVVVFPANGILNMSEGTPFNDDVSDLESTEDYMTRPNRDEEEDSDDDDDDDEEEDFFPDFPPNFDFQSKSIPPHFLCPLTKSIMINPVIDSEGNTYERRAILRWLDLEDVSPVTGNRLSAVDLIENKRRMAAIETYREEVWTAYNGDNKDESLFKREKSYREKHQMMKQQRKQFKKKGSKKAEEHDLITDKSAKLLMQMQEELNQLQGQQSNEKIESHGDNHVEYLLRKKAEDDKPKSMVMDRIKRRSGHANEVNTSMVRKENSKSPHKTKSSRKISPNPTEDLNNALVVRKPSSRSSHSPHKTSLTRKSTTSDLDLSDRSNHSRHSGLDSSDRANKHRNSLQSSCSSLIQTAPGSKSPHCEIKNTRLQDPDVMSSIRSLELVQNIPRPPIADPSPERKSSRRMVRDPAVSSSMKSMTSQGSKKVSPAPPPRSSKSPSGTLGTRASSYRSSPNMHGTTKDSNKCSITDKIIAEVNGCPDPSSSALVRAPSLKANPTTASTTSESQHSSVKLDHGWNVPLGVHKVICDAPGLIVTCDVHRRSAPVKRVHASTDATEKSRRRSCHPNEQLVVPPGAYIEVLETQVHGDRVRGRIEWEESIVVTIDGTHKASRKMSIKNLGHKLTHKKKNAGNSEQKTHVETHRYTGWVSLRWSDRDESNAGNRIHDTRSNKATDEDAGPWTEPVSLGVYSITFGHGLPIRKTSDRNSELVGMLEKGQYIEVVETQITGDRVRARCIPAPTSRGGAPLNGWISLFNAVTGSSGASAVPLGAYVTVTESGCTVTEGSSLNSKFKALLKRGSCVDIVSTRIEDGTVRGLISTGGYVTLIGPKRSHVKKNGKSSSPKDEQYLMHVPIGVYKVVYADGLPVMMGVYAGAPSAIDLELDSFVQVVETCVQNGRVYGRIIAVINDNVRVETHGWIFLFESKRRWCKFAFS
jgi:hypothetical protein